ncbi:hypothetical protein ZWY2020_037479 [Hordeum vulgare]|nr:hypothetical protein ZWY2020_037479 [Hordeum vulgare]
MCGSDDSQTDFEEPCVELNLGTSPKKSDSDHGSYSSHGLPKVSTRQRKKLNSNEEDSDFVREESSAPPKKAVRKISASSSQLRAPDYVRKNIAPSTDDAPKKTGSKRARKRVVRVVGRQTSMFEDLEEAVEEEDVIPAPPKKKLMADTMTKKSGPKPPNDKKSVAHRKTTKDITATAKKKCPSSSAPASEEEDDEDATILRELRPHLPIHNDAHPIDEDMNKRKDACIRKWRAADPYDVRRRTGVDPRFDTKERQDLYETVFLDKSRAVSDMRYVD